MVIKSSVLSILGPYTTLNTTCDIYHYLSELSYINGNNRAAPVMAVTHSVFRGEYSPRLFSGKHLSWGRLSVTRDSCFLYQNVKKRIHFCSV